jgi:hypothetical protein
MSVLRVLLVDDDPRVLSAMARSVQCVRSPWTSSPCRQSGSLVPLDHVEAELRLDRLAHLIDL